MAPLLKAGGRRALTDGLLRRLSPRELAGVLAHEIAHIANEDLRVMGLADSVSRLTSLLALMGQIAILLNLNRPGFSGGSNL
ncbi:M48 family metalloprotease [Pseudoxanthomonas mexicana]